MANIKILLQTAHVSLVQRRISPTAAPAMASQVWRRRNRRRRSEGKQEQEGTCSQALSLSPPTPIPLFLSLPLPRALSRALARARSLSLSLSLSLALTLMRRSFQMYCKYAHTQAHTPTHTKHTFPLLLTLTRSLFFPTKRQSLNLPTYDVDHRRRFAFSICRILPCPFGHKGRKTISRKFRKEKGRLPETSGARWSSRKLA
jgi:hypothetical protein